MSFKGKYEDEIPGLDDITDMKNIEDLADSVDAKNTDNTYSDSSVNFVASDWFVENIDGDEKSNQEDNDEAFDEKAGASSNIKPIYEKDNKQNSKKVKLLIIIICLLLFVLFIIIVIGKSNGGSSGNDTNNTESIPIATTAESTTTAATKEEEATTKKAESTTKKSEATTKKTESTTKKIESTTKKSENTTKKTESTTKKIESTTKKSENTTKKSEVTTEKITSDTTTTSTSHEDEYNFFSYFDGYFEYDENNSNGYPISIHTNNNEIAMIEYNKSFTQYRINSIMSPSECCIKLYENSKFKDFSDIDFYPKRYELTVEKYFETENFKSLNYVIYHSFESTGDGYIDHIEQYDYDQENDEEVFAGSWKDSCDSSGEIIKQGI